jgi:F0F1-type ATP synthase assembly protein I
VPGYDRERDQTVTTNASHNIVAATFVGAGIGFAIGSESALQALTTLAGALIGLLLALAILRWIGSRPMGY